MLCEFLANLIHLHIRKYELMFANTIHYETHQIMPQKIEKYKLPHLQNFVFQSLYIIIL